MRTSIGLTSSIAPVITRYLALKRALGRHSASMQYPFIRLDRFLAESRAADLTSETFGAWCSSIEHLSTGIRRKWMRVIYFFCLYRRHSEPDCFVPDPSQFPPPQPRPWPYIFPEPEITKLLLAADSLKPDGRSPLQGQVARLAIVLLYTTGLRRQELVNLSLGDYDAGTHTLLIRDSKFHKSRLVPLSIDAASEIDRYLERRRRPGFPCDADAALLLHNHGGKIGYTGTGLGTLLRKLFRKVGVRNSKDRSPRVHDFRFTFAVHALLRWYRAGVDVQAKLPALAAYMGHSSIVSTQYYLVFLNAVAEFASQRFHEHCASFLLPEPPLTGGGK
jgi:integrase/recombinase XerD